MKKLYLAIIGCMSFSLVFSQSFDFYGSEYYLSPDEGTNLGTLLTATGMDLSSFNYSSADPGHAIFATGLYYPIVDCANNNLWIRIQHIAADPNGTEYGFNIAQTLNSPFLPLGSTDRIGGWAGFLYDIQIFADQSINGTRAYTLDGLFATNITVESLETLYNDGGTLYEWLSFEILNQQTSGWTLNSTDFTGINPYSNPGFSSTLNYSTTATSTEPPTGFFTSFPTGSSNVYAVDLNLSGSYHSEFRMSAAQVSHFRYGYEFNTGGYQGMSLAFGGGPVINANLDNVSCAGYLDGLISLDVVGNGPFTYEWSNGQEDAINIYLQGGEYTVGVTDAFGCATTVTYIITEPDPIEISFSIVTEEGNTYLYAAATGGTGEYTFSWSTGSSNYYALVTAPGTYSVTVTDDIFCFAQAEFQVINVNENNGNKSTLYPNPASEMVTLNATHPDVDFQLINAQGQIVLMQSLRGKQGYQLDISSLPSGMYFYRQSSEGRISDKGTLIIQ